MTVIYIETGARFYAPRTEAVPVSPKPCHLLKLGIAGGDEDRKILLPGSGNELRNRRHLVLAVGIQGYDPAAPLFERPPEAGLERCSLPPVRAMGKEGDGQIGHQGGGAIKGTVVYHQDPIAKGTDLGHHPDNGTFGVVRRNYYARCHCSTNCPSGAKLNRPRR